jgi:hypothetical protein
MDRSSYKAWVVGVYDGFLARVAELADAPALGAGARRAWGFESPLSHRSSTMFPSRSPGSESLHGGRSRVSTGVGCNLATRYQRHSIRDTWTGSSTPLTATSCDSDALNSSPAAEIVSTLAKISPPCASAAILAAL